VLSVPVGAVATGALVAGGVNALNALNAASAGSAGGNDRANKRTTIRRGDAILEIPTASAMHIVAQRHRISVAQSAAVHAPLV
jgi:hypothetical protein